MPGHLERVAILDRPINEVFAFFADAGNLQQITPPELSFRILTPLPVEMQVGTLIDYRLRLFGLPFSWRTLISAWDPPHSFTDQQLRGPYREWRHSHLFLEVAGKTEMTDRVAYRLPFGPLGELITPLIERQLKQIFDYRQEKIQELLK